VTSPIPARLAAVSGHESVQHATRSAYIRSCKPECRCLGLARNCIRTQFATRLHGCARQDERGFNDVSARKLRGFELLW